MVIDTWAKWDFEVRLAPNIIRYDGQNKSEVHISKIVAKMAKFRPKIRKYINILINVFFVCLFVCLFCFFPGKTKTLKKLVFFV